MIRKSRVGLIVWGSILLTVGLFGLIYAFMIGSFSLRSYSTGFIGAVMTLVGGAILLTFGIRNAVRTNRENARLLEENRGMIYRGTCFTCGTPIETDIRHFSPHRNFPEGFVYCPICKRPISKNAFQREYIASYQPSSEWIR